MSKPRVRCYSELRRLDTFEERFEYLKLCAQIGIPTFGFDRYLNQRFYHLQEWKKARDAVIIRDGGCDLGIQDGEHDICDISIPGKKRLKNTIIVHHMNAVTMDDIENRNPDLFNPEYLITVSGATHNAIHYGDASLLPKPLVERRPNDTCPWKT